MGEKQRLIKYYLQQQMTSKAERKPPSRPQRSSRRLRSCVIAGQLFPEMDEVPCEANFEVAKNQIEPERQQQMKEKNERDSTSSPNHQNCLPCSSQENGKRFTRSSNQWRKVEPDLENQLDAFTPEYQPTTKIQLPATTKKTFKVLFIHPIPPPADINTLTLKKQTPKHPQPQDFAYNQPRKSYRKIHKRQIVSLPYRKCHDILQGRIVSILNKLQSTKNCSRDLEGLVERMQKISIRDMMNRYIVSGIKTIVNLVKERNAYDGTHGLLQTAAIGKMEGELAKLEGRIVEELARIDGFQIASSINQNDTNGLEHRSLLIRKLYKIMKRTYPQRNLKETRELAIKQCDKILSQDATHSNLLKFLKEKMQIAN